MNSRKGASPRPPHLHTVPHFSPDEKRGCRGTAGFVLSALWSKEEGSWLRKQR